MTLVHLAWCGQSLTMLVINPHPGPQPGSWVTASRWWGKQMPKPKQTTFTFSRSKNII